MIDGVSSAVGGGFGKVGGAITDFAAGFTSNVIGQIGYNEATGNGENVDYGRAMTAGGIDSIVGQAFDWSSKTLGGLFSGKNAGSYKYQHKWCR